MEEQQDVLKSVENEIFERSLDLSIDYAELALDTMVTTGFLKDIPFIKSLYSAYNIYASVTDRFRVKKILSFLRQLNSKTINQEKLEKFKKDFEDDKYRNEVMETIILLNERFMHVEKSKVLANLTRNLIEENISYIDFQYLSSILDAIQLRGLIYLRSWGDASPDFLGMRGMTFEEVPLLLACGIGHVHGSGIMINDMGRKFFKYGLAPLATNF